MLAPLTRRIRCMWEDVCMWEDGYGDGDGDGDAKEHAER